MKTTRIIEVTIDNELLDKVKGEAGKRYISVSAFVRMALADYLERINDETDTIGFR